MQLKIKSSPTTFDLRYVHPEKPLYFAREKMRSYIKSTFPAAEFYSPAKREHQALLSSRQAHCVLEHRGPTSSSPKEGFYIRIIAKKNGDPPTNPLWELKKTDGHDEEWEEVPFTTDPILLKEQTRYCIGGQFHFKVGTIQITSPPREDKGLPPASDPAPLILTTDGMEFRSISAPPMLKTQYMQSSRLVSLHRIAKSIRHFKGSMFTGHVDSRPAYIQLGCRPSLASCARELLRLRHYALLPIAKVALDQDTQAGLALIWRKPEDSKFFSDWLAADARLSVSAQLQPAEFVEQTFSFLLHIVEAMHFLSIMDWVHFDLRLGNILLVPGVAKDRPEASITGFGCAGRLDPTTAKVEAPEKGFLSKRMTPPELHAYGLDGSSSSVPPKVTRLTDVWGFGLLLCEVFLGTILFNYCFPEDEFVRQPEAVLAGLDELFSRDGVARMTDRDELPRRLQFDRREAPPGLKDATLRSSRLMKEAKDTLGMDVLDLVRQCLQKTDTARQTFEGFRYQFRTFRSLARK